MDPENKSSNFIFPTQYVIPKSLKFGHWLSENPPVTTVAKIHDSCMNKSTSKNQTNPAAGPLLVIAVVVGQTMNIPYNPVMMNIPLTNAILCQVT